MKYLISFCYVLNLFFSTHVIAQPVEKPADTAHEAFYNPFGDPWDAKKKINKDISIAFTAGCYFGPKGKETTIPEREVRFLNLSNVNIIYSECDHIDRNQERTKILSKALKTGSGNTKLIGYHLISMVEEHHPFYAYVKDKEDFFLHIKGKPKTRENRLMSRNNPQSNIYMLDISNKEFQKYVGEFIKENLERSGLDGFLADWVNPNPIIYSDEWPLIEDDIINNWGKHWGALLNQVRSTIGKDKIIIANYFGTPDGKMDFLDQISDPINGVMVEDLIGSKKTRWKDLRGGKEDSRQTIWNKVTTNLEKKGKRTFLVTNTNANCVETHSESCFKSKKVDEERVDSRYYLAAYLNIMTEGSVNYYYTPVASGPQFHSETYFQDWDLPVGKPLSISKEIYPHVYYREFENAHVYWNNSPNAHQLKFKAGVYLPRNLNSPLTKTLLDAESGEVFMKNNNFSR